MLTLIVRRPARTTTTTTLFARRLPWHRHATLPPRPQSRTTILLAAPSTEHIHKEELDVNLPPVADVRLVLTDRAAEQLRTIAARENDPGAALRIAVQSGGCHGYQYKMELATGRAPDDYHFVHPTLRPSNILVDAVSFSLINGATVDFATELIGSSFQVADNPNAKGSGCGCGVSWELKE